MLHKLDMIGIQGIYTWDTCTGAGGLVRDFCIGFLYRILDGKSFLSGSRAQRIVHKNSVHREV